MAPRKDFAKRHRTRVRRETNLRARGFMPVGRYPFRQDTDPPGVLSYLPGTIAALRSFKLPYKIALTRSAENGPELWVTRKVHAVLETLHAARHLLVYPSFPEVARRFAAQPYELFTTFDGARRLGAAEDTLRKILEPVSKRLKQTAPCPDV